MGFLYEEVGTGDQLRMAAHLQSCPTCQRQVAAWRGSMAGLSQWKIAEPTRWRARQPWLAWAAAAAVFLAAGITIGATSRTSPDLATLRAALEPSIKASIEKDLQKQWQSNVEQTVAATREKLLADLHDRIDKTASQAEVTKLQMSQLMRAMAENRVRDHEEIFAAFRELEAQRLAELENLRTDLETVAVSTEEGFKKAQKQLVQLASYTGMP